MDVIAEASSKNAYQDFIQRLKQELTEYTTRFLQKNPSEKWLALAKNLLEYLNSDASNHLTSLMNYLEQEILGQGYASNFFFGKKDYYQDTYPSEIYKIYIKFIHDMMPVSFKLLADAYENLQGAYNEVSSELKAANQAIHNSELIVARSQERDESQKEFREFFKATLDQVFKQHIEETNRPALEAPGAQGFFHQARSEDEAYVVSENILSQSRVLLLRELSRLEAELDADDDRHELYASAIVTLATSPAPIAEALRDYQLPCDIPDTQDTIENPERALRYAGILIRETYRNNALAEFIDIEYKQRYLARVEGLVDEHDDSSEDNRMKQSKK